MDEKDKQELLDLLKNIKLLRRSANDMEWKEAWGKSGVSEKILVSKADGLPFSVTLKKFPLRKEIVTEGGYTLHAHPTLEVGYCIKGKHKGYFEDIGVLEEDEGQFIIQPVGLKHAVVSTDVETIVIATNIPAVGWEEPETAKVEAGKSGQKLLELLKGVKPIRRIANDMEWKEAWGKSGVSEKILVSKADGLPFSVTLKKFPIQKEIVKEGGYTLHAHPTLQISYTIKGKGRSYFEDVGVVEIAEGTLLVQPVGLKHAVVSTDEETIVIAINIPAVVWEEQ